jgi:hypothetical protein
MPRRLLRKAVRQGRSKRGGEAYSAPYVELLSVARTPLEDFVNSLLIDDSRPFLIDVQHESAVLERSLRVPRIVSEVLRNFREPE